MGNQLAHNHHRRRRNLPAELKVEIVDCLPVGNAVHFLANVPTRLIIHHCAPRLRRMLEKKIHQIVIGYARTLPAASRDGNIHFENGRKYTSEMDIFLRYGAAHCRGFYIWRGISDGLLGYPANFFNDLIKHYYESETASKAVHRVSIGLSMTNPAPWPMALAQPQAGQMKLEKKVNNDGKRVRYFLRTKHNPNIAFVLYIHFEGGAKCYQQMTRFSIWRVENAQSRGGCSIL